MVRLLRHSQRKRRAPARSHLPVPRLPSTLPTCSLAFLSRLSHFLGVTRPDHPSKDRCQGCSSATVVLDNITSQGLAFRTKTSALWMCDFHTSVKPPEMITTRPAATPRQDYKAVEQLARRRPTDSP